MKSEKRTELEANRKRWIKNVALLLGYWAIFNALPFLLTSNQCESSAFSSIMLLLVLLSPALIFIPYNLATFKQRLEAIIFILVGMSIPLICVVYILKNVRVGLF